jgi:alpha,alpha-trehalase
MKNWKLTYETFNPEQEGLREALCTLGNGFFASRGAAPESKADKTHYPGTYIAGCYNRLKSEIGGRTIEDESLVNIPNWLELNFRIENGEWFDISAVDVIDFHQELDIKQAILKRKVIFKDQEGRQTQVEQWRLVSIDQPHLAALKTLIHAQDWSGSIEIRSALDARITNAGVERYRDLNSRHLKALSSGSFNDNAIWLEAQTNQSRVCISQAATTRMWQGEQRLELTPQVDQSEDHIAQHFTTGLNQGQTLRIEKTFSLYTSRDHAISESGLEARKAVSTAEGFDDLSRRHILRWKQLWQRFDFDIEHDDPQEEEKTERILRLHILHLIQTTSPHVIDLDVGIPARGLHGEAYRGHIFWDELFVFPLFNLRMPEITRALLLYRYRRLDEARRGARKAGHQGAMYPWQSGSNGREESQFVHLNPKSGNWIPDNSRLQRHINAAVAYNIWQYYQVTHDMEFLSFYGAEMLFEIARFWSSITTYNDHLKRYEILQVMGPDEYHDAYPDSEQPGLNNNAYTNIMVVWVLMRALELRDILPSQRFNELCETLNISQQELDHWENISRKIYVPFHQDEKGNNIISQFKGYENLLEFDWGRYIEKYGDIQRLDRILEAEENSPNRYKVSKQADVLMLFYLFSSEELKELFDRIGYPFQYDTIPHNIDYYMERTSHGSTLSRVVSAWVLARANRAEAWPLFTQALESDVADIQGGTTPEGIHTGAMAGTVDLIQRCFSGIAVHGDVLWLNPSLPKGLNCLILNIQYRKHLLNIHMTTSCVRITTESSVETTIKIGLGENIYELQACEVRDFQL